MKSFLYCSTIIKVHNVSVYEYTVKSLWTIFPFLLLTRIWRQAALTSLKRKKMNYWKLFENINAVKDKGLKIFILNVEWFKRKKILILNVEGLSDNG